MATETQASPSEARRQKLAREAAEYEQAQAELKAHHEAFKVLDEAEKKRVESHKEALKGLLKERGRLQARTQSAGRAMELLRQEFVPLEVRQSLSAAARDERSARQRAERARQDMERGAESLASLKERAKKISSTASAAEIREEIKRVEDGQAGLEAAHAGALEGLALAEQRHEKAKAVHKAAMDAARAL